jgi:hypothetical protein
MSTTDWKKSWTRVVEFPQKRTFIPHMPMPKAEESPIATLPAEDVNAGIIFQNGSSAPIDALVQTSSQSVSDSVSSAIGNVVSLQEGEVLLPSFIREGSDGLYADFETLRNPDDFHRFVDRTFASGAFFRGVDLEKLAFLCYGVP